MRKSDCIDKLAAALAKAQGEIEGARKDSANPFFKSRYADLESVVGACRPALVANGLSITQLMGGTTEQPTLITVLMHSSGQWIEGEQPLFAQGKNGQAPNAQDMGSAISYARRYGLSAMVGVVQVDDDGEAAVGRPPQGGPQMGKTNGSAANASVAAQTQAKTEDIARRLGGSAPVQATNSPARSGHSGVPASSDREVNELFGVASGAAAAKPAEAKKAPPAPAQALTPKTPEEIAWYKAKMKEEIAACEKIGKLHALWLSNTYIIGNLCAADRAEIEAMKEEKKKTLNG